MHNAHTCWNPEPTEPIMSLNDSRLDSEGVGMANLLGY